MSARKTLGRSITANFFARESGFSDIASAWRAHLADGNAVGCEHIALYAILRGKDWTKGFTPVTNPRKLSGGLSADGTKLWALGRITRTTFDPIRQAASDNHLLEPFGDALSPDALRLVRALVHHDGYCVPDA